MRQSQFPYSHCTSDFCFSAEQSLSVVIGTRLPQVKRTPVTFAALFHFI
jgi:hypothetical protein